MYYISNTAFLAFSKSFLESIWKALHMGALRIGHGVCAVKDHRLMDELAKRGCVLEIALKAPP